MLNTSEWDAWFGELPERSPPLRAVPVVPIFHRMRQQQSTLLRTNSDLRWNHSSVERPSLTNASGCPLSISGLRTHQLRLEPIRRIISGKCGQHQGKCRKANPQSRFPAAPTSPRGSSNTSPPPETPLILPPPAPPSREHDSAGSPRHRKTIPRPPQTISNKNFVSLECFRCQFPPARTVSPILRQPRSRHERERQQHAGFHTAHTPRIIL